VVTGIRPGEKVHEILVSEEECHRTVDRGDYYSILPMLPEVQSETQFAPALHGEYSSAGSVMDGKAVAELLRKHRLRVEDQLVIEGELLR
jgi:UDP-glucose 4-epimerase